MKAEDKTTGSYNIIAGSYTGGDGNDIHLLRLDGRNSELLLTGGIRVGDNPSFITLSPDASIVYAVNETDNFSGSGGGGITTLGFRSGMSELITLGEIGITGKGPCHISANGDGSYLYASNYGDGSFSVIANNDKGIPEIEAVYLKYQSNNTSSSHAHMSYQQPGGNTLYVSDLGLDRLMVYHIIRNGDNINLREDDPIYLRQGSGPRHFVIDTTGTVLYILNELRSEITVVKRYLTGDFREIQSISTLPVDYNGENYAADLHWSNDNRFLYASNRGHNSIALFEIIEDEKLEFRGTVSCEGDWPRNFAISPDGRQMLIANERSGSIDLFTIDPETRLPVYTGKSVKVNSPSCIIFMPL